MAALEDLRAKTKELLDEGLASGSLTAEEHQWRTGHLAAAASVDDLEVLVEDLLGPAPPTGTAVAVPRVSHLNVLSNRTFAPDDLGRRSELVTILGSTRIDLASLAAGDPLTLELVTILGDAVVVVPPGVTVKIDCTPVMGDLRVDPEVRGNDAVLRIAGVVLMGSLRVMRGPTRGR